MNHAADLGPLSVDPGLLLDERRQDHGVVRRDAQGGRAGLDGEVVDHLQELAVHAYEQPQFVADRRLVQLVGVGEQQSLYVQGADVVRIVLPDEPVAGQRRPQPRQVSAPALGVYAVGVAVDVLYEAVVVLQGGLYLGAVDKLLDVDWVLVDYTPGLVEAADEAGYAALEVVGDLVIGPQVGMPVAQEGDLEALVQIGHLPEPLAQRIVVVLHRAEYARVGHEGDGGASARAGAFLNQLGGRLPLGKLLGVQPTVPPDLYSHILGERIDYGRPHAVKAA